MTIERKLLGTSPSGGATDVAEVFSTHLYTGNAGVNAINNGIDLAGEGGMVWFKDRKVDNINHVIVDTERGPTKYLYGLSTVTETSLTNSLTSFNSNGFSLGTDDGDWVNANNRSYVSWTFRKKKKFFDVITYSGNGTAGRTISHGLDGPVGMVIIKRTDTANYNWTVWHRSSSSNNLFLNATGAQFSSGGRIASASSTNFTVGTAGGVNNGSGTYVAYVFADNSSEDAEDQMIKCGSYSGNSSTNGPFVDLGWEPQFVLIKALNANESWMMFDSMRGISTGGNDAKLSPNTIALENYGDYLELNATGFTLKTTDAAFNGTSKNYLYMAIRAPMMIEPEAATDVFHVESYTGDNVANRKITTGFAVDANITVGYDSARPPCLGTRITDGMFQTTSSSVQYDSLNDWIGYDNNDGIRYTSAYDFSNTSNVPFSTLSWKRAKGFFDVVAYTGTGSTQTILHSLAVIPEMIWVKNRTSTSDWSVYVKDALSAGAMNYGWLNLGNQFTASNWPFVVAPNATEFFVRGGETAINVTNNNHIAFLFASLDGISKVGSYTGNGSSQTISCGFSAGARFILIKRTNAERDWYVWDTTRGIVAGNDPHLSLNTAAAQVTNDDSVDPHNSGFIVNQVSATNINVSSGTYIFYAIA